MKKFFFGCLIAFLPAAGLYAQDIVHPFELSWPLFKVSNSLYNKIDLIDSRAYTAAIGVIEKGLTPTQAEKIVFRTPIEPQFTGLMRVLTDNTARDGELLFQLKRFRFVETSGVRYCFLSAALYAKKEDRYFPLSQLNTVIPLSTRIWKNLQSKANSLLTDFLAKGLLMPAADTLSYSLRDVGNIDSIEKRSIPLYTAAAFTDGIYRTPRAFLEQRPDWTALAVEAKRDGSVTSVTALYANGESRPVERTKMFAFVYKGRPFMVTEYGFYPLERLGNDFYFTGDVRVGADLNDQLNSSFIFGLAGAALSSRGYRSSYQILLDHQTGGYVFVRRLPPPNVWNGRPDPDDY